MAASKRWQRPQTDGINGQRRMPGPPLIDVKIERLAGDRGALHDFAFNGEHGASARDLFLTFAQPVRAAKVRRDTRRHVTESTRHLEPRVAVKEQLFTIGHPATSLRRARDHLAERLPVPNCSHNSIGSFWLHLALPGKPYAPTSLAATRLTDLP